MKIMEAIHLSGNSAVKAVNSSLLSPTKPDRLVKALQIPELQLHGVNAEAAPLYLAEMRNYKELKNASLSYEDIVEEADGLSLLCVLYFGLLECVAIKLIHSSLESSMTI